MLKATNIRINGNMILCTVSGTDFEIELQIIIGDWNNITVSDKDYYMEGSLVRNRIHRLYDEKNGKLPDSFSLYFG